MGLSVEQARSSLRFSLGRSTDAASIQALIDTLEAVLPVELGRAASAVHA